MARGRLDSYCTFVSEKTRVDSHLYHGVIAGPRGLWFDNG